MKSIVRLWMLAGLLVVSAVNADEQIPWARDFQTACELASEQRRLVLLHFYNDNCPPCLRVDQNVFSQPQVAEAVAQNYVPVKVHAGKTPQLASRYQVMRWPTDVIVTPAGLEVYRAISPQKPDDYIALVNQVAVQTGTGTGRQWKADQNPTMQRANATIPKSPAPTSVAAPSSASQFANGPQGNTGQGQSPSNETATTSQGAANSAFGANPPGRRSSFSPADASGASGSSDASFTSPPTQPAATAPQWPANGAQAPLPTENPWFAAARSGTSSIASAELPVGAPQSLAKDFTPPAQPSATAQTAIPQPPALAQQPSEQSYFSPTASETLSTPQSPPTAAAIPPAASVAPASAQSASVGPTLIPADQAPPIALGGHCPVTLIEGNTWRKADPLYGAIHEGQTYLFVSTAEQQRFLADPRRYALPPLGMDGFCPVTLRDQMKWQRADRQHFAVHRGRMYFFTTAAEREKFLTAPDAYAPVLSGCDSVRFAQRGELIEGKRAFGLITKDKEIFLFADQQSLETFEQNPTAYQNRVRQAMAQSDGQTAYR